MAGSTTSCSLPTLKSATIEECLAKEDTDELSREEKKLFTRLGKRKLCTSKDRSILKCKTGGHPIVFYRVPAARKSADVKSPLKKTTTNKHKQTNKHNAKQNKNRNAKVVEKVYRQMTGGGEESEVKQYEKVYKRMPATKKEKLFQLTGCTKKVVVN